MKKSIFTISILFVLFFTGCTNSSTSHSAGAAAPATSSPSTVSTTDSFPVTLSLISSPDGSSSGAITENGYYSLSALEDGSLNINYLDFQTKEQIILCNAPNCQHNNETCTGWIEPGHGGASTLIINDSLVFIFKGNMQNTQYNKIAPHIITMDFNGQNRKQILELSANEVLIPPFASDGKNLYCFYNRYNYDNDAVTLEQAIIKIDIEHARIEKIYEFNDEMLSLVGAFDNYLVLKETVLPLQPPNLDFNLKLFSVTDMSFSTLHSWKSGEERSFVSGDKCYFAVSASNSILEYDCRNRNAHPLDITLPIPSELGFDSLSFIIAFDDIIIFEIYDPGNTPKDVTYHRYGYNTTTGELKELSLNTYFDGISEPILIIAENTDYLLVASELEQRTQTLFNSDGSTYVTSSICEIYSLISKKNYWNSVPQYITFDSATF